MSRITPTAHAEEAYQAQLNAKFDRQMRRGPAGILIPPAPQLFRKTVDGPLLALIARVAFADWRRRLLPAERFQAVAASLRADALARFPEADMQVLERYGCASPQERATIEMLAGNFERVEQIQLAQPMLSPRPLLFHVDLGGRGSSSGTPVPSDTVQFFRDVVTARGEKVRSFDAATHWVGVSRTQEGRWPRWQEIERQFPLIGEWLEGQRR